MRRCAPIGGSSGPLDNFTKDKRKMRKAEAYLNIRRLYRKTLHYAARDPEVALMLARKTTEAICKFIFATKISPEPNSLMLDGLLSRLARERTVPRKILTPMRTVQSYGNFGGHDQEDEYGEIERDYGRPCVDALRTIVDWFQGENALIDWALTTSVHHVGLSERALKILDNVSLTSLAEVALKTEAELLKYRGLGQKILNEIKSVLEQHELQLGLHIDLELIENLYNKRIHSDSL